MTIREHLLLMAVANALIEMKNTGTVDLNNPDAEDAAFAMDKVEDLYERITKDNLPSDAALAARDALSPATRKELDTPPERGSGAPSYTTLKRELDKTRFALGEVGAQLGRVRAAVKALHTEPVYEDGSLSGGISVRFLARMTIIEAEIGLADEDNAFVKEARAMFTPSSRFRTNTSPHGQPRTTHILCPPGWRETTDSDGFTDDGCVPITPTEPGYDPALDPKLNGGIVDHIKTAAERADRETDTVRAAADLNRKEPTGGPYCPRCGNTP